MYLKGFNSWLRTSRTEKSQVPMAGFGIQMMAKTKTFSKCKIIPLTGHSHEFTIAILNIIPLESKIMSMEERLTGTV
jgi:hypothetical protein